MESYPIPALLVVVKEVLVSNPAIEGFWRYPQIP
jgi:hypothetical protein